MSRDFLFFLFFIFFLGRPKVCGSSYSLRQIRRVVVVGFTKIGRGGKPTPEVGTEKSGPSIFVGLVMSIFEIESPAFLF